MGCYIKNLNPKDSIVFSFKCHLNTVTCQYTFSFPGFGGFSCFNFIFLWFCYLFSFEYDSAVTLLPFLVSILFFCDFATFSHLNMIVLWLCYLFLFQYYISVILLPFLVSILYFCDFATYFFLGLYIYCRKGSKMFDMIWFWLNFLLNFWTVGFSFKQGFDAWPLDLQFCLPNLEEFAARRGLRYCASPRKCAPSAPSRGETGWAGMCGARAVERSVFSASGDPMGDTTVAFRWIFFACEEVLQEVNATQRLHKEKQMLDQKVNAKSRL